MADYRTTDGDKVYVEKKSGAGRTIAILLVIALVIVGVLFATGFWSADVKGGSMPKVNVSTQEGAMPDVDMHSKELVVGTKKTTVDVPKVETKKTEVDVPTVGVKN